MCSSGNSGPLITDQKSVAGPLRRKGPRMDPCCLCGIVLAVLFSISKTIKNIVTIGCANGCENEFVMFKLFIPRVL